ncbi:MAG: TRAP transporter small permease subunit [Gammaproteobacteria bacterium]|nr:TRAP transporter small permease subunit [Gammaproteobacteria bacterium]
MRSKLIRAEQVFNRFSDWIGTFSAVLLLLLVLNVFYDVVMRYLFNDVSIGMQELEWHLYSMIFLFGIAYTLKSDGHVRVDVIYERLSVKKRAIIDILGTLFFLWPFCALVAGYGIGFAYEAYDINEVSGDPGGLPYRWLIKGMICASLICVLISSIGFVLRAINEYLGLQPPHGHETFQP